MNEFERVEITSRPGLRRWLLQHHTQAQSVWLVTYKRNAGAKYLPYDEIVEEALCFGWVDSQPRALDAERSMRLLSPRNPASAWSAVNKRRVAKLIGANLMHASGLRAIRSAKASGAWTRIDEVERLAVPADLAKALRATPGAAVLFKAFPASAKRAILEWIANAKTDGTRQRRVSETARLAAQNIRANQYRQPKRRTRS